MNDDTWFCLCKNYIENVYTFEVRYTNKWYFYHCFKPFIHFYVVLAPPGTYPKNSKVFAWYLYDYNNKHKNKKSFEESWYDTSLIEDPLKHIIEYLKKVKF